MAPVIQFTSQDDDDDQPGEAVTLKRRINYVEDTSKPLLWVTHIKSYHYGKLMFEIDFVPWTEMLAWLWVVYRIMCEDHMVCPFTVEELQPTILLDTVIEKVEAAVSLVIYKARLWKLESVVLPFCWKSPIP